MNKIAGAFPILLFVMVILVSLNTALTAAATSSNASALLQCSNGDASEAESAIKVLVKVGATKNSPGNAWVGNVAPWIGPAIIAAIVTVLGNWLLAKRNSKKERERLEQEALNDAVNPVLETADDIVARFFDLVVRGAKHNFDKIAIPKPEKAFDNIDATELSTIYRFMRLFAAVSYLQRKMPTYGWSSRVREAEFYVGNKVRMALKGNITGSAKRLPTEAQQFFGSVFLHHVADKHPANLDFYQFIDIANKDNQALAAIENLAQVLNVKPDYLSLEADQIRLVLALIYLIDFQQDTLYHSKWEEFRVFLVSLVLAWNAKTPKRSIFLYSLNDIKQDDYMASFAKRDYLEEWRFGRWWRLRKRQNRGRSLSASGLTKHHGDTTLKLEISKKPEDLFDLLKQLARR